MTFFCLTYFDTIPAIGICSFLEVFSTSNNKNRFFFPCTVASWTSALVNLKDLFAVTTSTFLKDTPLFGSEVLFSAFSAFTAVEVLAADELSLLAELELLTPAKKNIDKVATDSKNCFYFFSS